VAFLPSLVDSRVPVANRYFGVFQDGTLKVRGLEARRRDTPPWIADTQMKMLEYLAQAPTAKDLPELIPSAFGSSTGPLGTCGAGHRWLLRQHRQSKVVEATESFHRRGAVIQRAQATGNPCNGRAVTLPVYRGQAGSLRLGPTGQPD
jgi:hypothetical protein